MRIWPLLLLPWFALMGLLLVWQQNPTWVKVLRLKAFDTYQQSWPRQKPQNSPVVVVDIDEKSLAEIGQWPWPRTILAKLVQQTFETYHANVLGFDIVFAEPDRTSPAQMAQHGSLPKNLAQQLKQLPSHDALFAKTLKNYNVVLGYALDNTQQAPPHNNFDVFSDVTGTKLGALPVPHVNKLIRNLPKLEDAAPALGWFGYIPDVDNIIRRTPLLIHHQNTVFAPLAVKVLRGASPSRTLQPVLDSFGDMTHLKIGDLTIPMAKDSTYWIHFRPFDATNYVSAVDILKGRVPKNKLANKIVLVGTSAKGLLDLRATPLNASVPGVDVHMQIIETMRSKQFLQRPEWMEQAELIVSGILGVLMLVAVTFLGALAGAIVTVIFVAMAVGGSIWSFTSLGWLIDPVLPFLTLLGIYGVHVVIKYMHEEYTRKTIRNAFAHYLSPQMVNILTKQPKSLKLGGQSKDMTVLFSDVADFTAISESLPPEKLTYLMNKYLTPMTEIILSHQGTVDKYMGDAIMAFWNAPLKVENHAEEACKAALKMKTTLTALNDGLEKEGYPRLKMRLGISSGITTVGNMGSNQRFDYTVMGDEVNIAARLESAGKKYGYGILVSEQVKFKVPNGVFFPIDFVVVQGKTEPVEVFDYLGMVNEVTDDIQQDVTTMLRAIFAFRSRQWDEAILLFKQVKTHKELIRIYLKRVAEFKKTPPHSNWNGAVERREK